MADSVSDDDRKKLEAAILAALTLIYRGKAREALDRLGLIDTEVTVSEDAATQLTTFARERAHLIQRGINQRLDGLDGLEYDAALREIQTYNATVLQPFLISTAAHRGLIDAYRATPDAMAKASSAAQAHLWVWTQFSDNPDGCQEAAGMGPAPLDDLLAVTGSTPPVHERCSCNLDPI